MKRQSHRLALALPMELQNGNGVTRDISTSGVFFQTGLSFSAGTEIIFSLLLEHADPVGPIRLHCQGKVVRVEHLCGKIGVAVAIDELRLDPIEALPGPARPWAQRWQHWTLFDQTRTPHRNGGR